ncbi:MAG TPA: hypothetical protein PLJ00_15780 [Chitinophagales bacterium]|nr:hypothetical protein [Chitinophagales bacterium]
MFTAAVPEPEPPTSSYVVKGFISQHGADAPELTINRISPYVTIYAEQINPGVYDIVCTEPIFKDLKTHFYIAPQDCLTDLSGGIAYGSRYDNYRIRIVNWDYGSGFPTTELNQLAFTIEVF